MHTAKHPLIPESSAADTNQYRWFMLANGLRVLAIHSPHSKQSAAAFAVNAGHFHDPQSAPGVAHFLEHLILLGSKQFPEADGFATLINSHSGHFNAWTGTEHSNYYFTSSVTGFAPCLAHFSSLLIQPLLSQEWVDKERQSIEAEYRLKQKDELRRLYEVHKTTANPLHPFAKFSVGNAVTLADGDIPIRSTLLEFHQQWYCANNAALVVAGPQPLAELIALAESAFQRMPAGSGPTANATAGTANSSPVLAGTMALPNCPMYLPEQLGCFIYMRPIRQTNRLIITFPLAEINSDYSHKTTSFIAHLLGHEGPGSLCYFLRQQHWIQELSAGGGMSGYNFKDFHLNLQLTDSGMQHIDTIVQAAFNYIKTVAAEGLNGALYEERQQMMALAYRFPEASKTVELVSQLAINMLHYAPNHVVSGDYLMQGLRPNFAQQLLRMMVPERARITVISPSVAVTQRSHFYHAEYALVPLTSEQLHTYRQPLATHWQADFQVPASNPYIPKRVAPLAIDDQQQPQQPASLPGACERSGYWPQLIMQQQGVTLWHLQDAHFREPQAHIYLSLQLPLANASAKNQAISRIWCELGQELLTEQFYDAELAGMHFNLYPQQSGITLHLSGFSDRQPELFQDLMSSLAKLRSSAEHFHTVRQQLQRNWQATHQNKPVNHLFSLLHHQLQYGAYTAQQLADSIVDLDFEHYCDLLPGMLRDAQAVVMIHGDIAADTALQIGQWVAHALPVVAQPKTHVSRTVKRLHQETVRLTFDNQHSDHAFALFFQGESTELAEKAAFLVLNHLFSARFFHQLRTEQQLGYLVGSSYLPMHGIPGLLCYVQSPNTASVAIEAAVNSFVNDFLHTLRKLSVADFNQAQQAVLHHLTDPAPNLRTRAQRYWSAIINNRGDFQLAIKVAHAAEALTLGQLQQFADKRLGTERSAMLLVDSKAQG